MLQSLGSQSVTTERLNWTDDHVQSVYHALLFECLAPRHLAYTYKNFCHAEITSPVWQMLARSGRTEST